MKIENFIATYNQTNMIVVSSNIAKILRTHKLGGYYLRSNENSTKIIHQITSNINFSNSKYVRSILINKSLNTDEILGKHGVVIGMNIFPETNFNLRIIDLEGKAYYLFTKIDKEF